MGRKCPMPLPTSCRLDSLPWSRVDADPHNRNRHFQFSAGLQAEVCPGIRSRTESVMNVDRTRRNSGLRCTGMHCMKQYRRIESAGKADGHRITGMDMAGNAGRYRLQHRLS